MENALPGLHGVSRTSSRTFLPLLGFFGDPQVEECFTLDAYIEGWLVVECALARAQARLGLIPEVAAAEIERAATRENVDLERLRADTRVVGYPILPLLTQLAEVGPATVGDFLHWGATTQDIMDTGLVLQLGRALDRIEALTVRLGDCLGEKAEEGSAVAMVARTHGQPAVPTTFGAKVAVWLSEVQRHLERLQAARERALVVQLFGAAGTSAAFGERSEILRRAIADELHLGCVEIPWHTARDSLAEVGFVLAAIAATCGKIGREVIELSRPEIGELREAPAGGLRGASSTMPQKANPINSEVAVGLSGVAAQLVPTLLAAMQAPHERGAGEWQLEWDVLPTVCLAAAGGLQSAVQIMTDLQIHKARMSANLESDGMTLMAEAAMMALAPLMGRHTAHTTVYDACLATRERGVDFGRALREAVGDDVRVDFDAVLDPRRYLGSTVRIVAAALERWRTRPGSQM